jgi:hypothetical protein
MAPLQDILNLGNDARMNLPGRAEGNWRWRCTGDMLAPAAFEWLRDLTKTSNRTSYYLDFGHFWGPITSPEQDTINGPIIKCCTVNVRRKVCCLTRMVRIFASASYGIGNRLLH